MPNSFLPSSTPLSVQLEYQSAAIPFPRLLGNFPVQILTMFEEYQSVKADGKSCWLRWLWSLGAPPSALHHPGQAAASDTPMSGAEVTSGVSGLPLHCPETVWDAPGILEKIGTFPLHRTSQNHEHLETYIPCLKAVKNLCRGCLFALGKTVY